ncbi:hypothetical protein [Mesobacillus selenatarsenatis]|uniref:Uncharacterized protein n=1 Tax=Mesobacillus selenatarsenatis (strain DSM 18680 / JCM 14380 / FERM P-15431 / SF-1) TaxID=1321606 RepID=A0A0A8X509_MESS1|nr:hypothetical protein [Mesobacillus selenatarsenatis]GAM14127.1 hypothetical protein SAMD00020551_2275 [Mesobacillus selenatarsenatis SF-1]
MMIDIGVIIVLMLSLWSITITLQKLADRIMKKQEQQYELLKEIKDLLKNEK